jgi:phosphonate transport system permease protein
MPQILGQYISITLYNLEMNVRSAAILGYVGAGGLGLLLNEKLGWRQYDKVGLILFALLITVYAIESISRLIRKKLS